MTPPSAVLIGFQDQGNLGVGYLAATLAQHGFTARMLDFRQEADSILETVRAEQPVLVGFSLIFQYYLPQFAQLAAYLRDNGVTCHFCAGGHFPSLRSAEVLNASPALDSVVRGEGELTLIELMTCLAEKRDWHQVAGLGYRGERQCVLTPARALIAQLDDVPYPVRPADDQAVLGRKVSPLLASRGCARHCAFCSIRQFYAQGQGQQVRVRSPAKVAEEMRVLHEERHTRIFLFQDDDFPIWGAFGRRWAEQFIESLQAEGLIGRVIWKISCRADEVERDLFARLRAAGLYTVYLGLESGNAAGLRTLNKGLQVDDSLRAVATLEELDLFFCYGFMLLDPSSTFDAVRANVAFLELIAGAGSTAALFCRMLPYAGTPIEARLAEEGRLRGNVVEPDYAFADPRMDGFFEALHEATAGWIHGPDALVSQFNWAWQEYWVLRRLFPPLAGLASYAEALRVITRRGNEYLLRFVTATATAFEQGPDERPPTDEVKATAQALADQLLAERDAFILQNQATLLGALQSAN